MLRRIFQTESSARNFVERGIFRKYETFSKEFYDGGCILCRGTFHRGVSREEREFFMEAEPDLPALL